MDERAIQELVHFQSDDAPVLSLYLNVDPHRRNREKYKLALRRLLESVADRADPRDVARVERYIDIEYNWQGRAVACFSCQGRDFWRAFPLWLPREDLVFLGRRPYIEPLMDLVGRYAIAVVHQEGARLSILSMGVLREVQEITGEEVKRHRAGGWASRRYQSHEDETAQRNLRAVAERMDSFCQRHRCEHLILGGTETNIAQFEMLLPKAIRQRVIGRIAVDKDAPAAEIVERALEAVQGHLAERERALVEEIITTAAKGGAATTGLADTLGALHAGRIRHLVVEKGFRSPAYRCQNCGYLTVEPAERCTFCDGQRVYLPDAVESLIRHAISEGIEVTLVDGSEALREAGHIGALLRY